MATQWHYRRNDVQLGPVGFHELVRLVRAEELEADDLVREEWNSDWRHAALAVGLFHMAGRQDLFDQWEAEQAERRRLEEEARAAAGLLGEDEPAWQKRLREVEAEQLSLEAEERAEREAELVASATRTEIDEALSAALAEIEARERTLEPTRLQRIWRSITSPEVSHGLVRWIPTLAAPNLLAVGIFQWSEMQLQRFPSRDTLVSGVRPFPFWGACDSSMYVFLLVDVMIFTAFATYHIARIVERCADD